MRNDAVSTCFVFWASMLHGTRALNGAVYVGWYDDRNDPFDTKVEYFVGKSTDGGDSPSRRLSATLHLIRVSAFRAAVSLATILS
jgi:hypothetical protein